MRSQRAGVAENPAEMQFVKWTTEGPVNEAKLLVFRNVGHASDAGDMIVFRRGCGFCNADSIKQGGTAVF